MRDLFVLVDVDALKNPERTALIDYARKHPRDFIGISQLAWEARCEHRCISYDEYLMLLDGKLPG